MSTPRVPLVTNDSLYRLYLVLEVLRSTGEREFPMQLAGTFFWIAAHDGCLQEELAEAMSTTLSSVSRNVTWLGPRHRLGKEGLKLVRREKDPIYPRKWRLYLTPKGTQFINLIEQTLSGKSP